MKKQLFLVSFLATSLFVESHAKSEYHSYGDAEVYDSTEFLEVNDRDLENNRDFSTMVQDGLIYGLFKRTSNRGKIDCVD